MRYSTAYADVVGLWLIMHGDSIYAEVPGGPAAAQRAQRIAAVLFQSTRP